MKKMMMAAAAILAAAGTAYAFTDEGSRRFSEFLNGLNEAAAVVSTTGNGTFRATISKDGSEINYELTFKDLEGIRDHAAVHFEQSERLAQREGERHPYGRRGADRRRQRHRWRNGHHTG